jgi:glycosyltransferase involved in cell wall biosynthesis
MDVVFAGLDIVLLTSLNEGTPVSIMEAMAAGKPVISTNVGGIAELVVADETGFFGSTAEALSTKVRLLLEQPALADRMGQKAAKTAEDRFSHTTEFVELSGLYNSLLSAQKLL